jgi:hypothetical protein
MPVPITDANQLGVMDATVLARPGVRGAAAPDVLRVLVLVLVLVLVPDGGGASVIVPA